MGAWANDNHPSPPRHSVVPHLPQRYINTHAEAKAHCRRTAQKRLPRDRFQAQQATKVVERPLEKTLSRRESTVVMTSHWLVRNKRHCTHYPTRLLHPRVASRGDSMGCVHEPLRAVAPALRYLESEVVITCVLHTCSSSAQEVRAVSVCAALGASGQREVAGGTRLAVMKFNSWAFALRLLCLVW